MADVKLGIEDCREILNTFYENQEFTILEFSQEPITKENLLLKVQVQREDEVRCLKFFIKSPPKEGQNSSFANKEENYKKESLAHTSLLKTIKESFGNINLDFIAKYYTNIRDDMIVVENAYAEGYKKCRTADMTKAHVNVGLEALAKLHAVSIAYEEKRRNLKISYQLIDEFSDVLKETLYCPEKECKGYQFLHASLKGLATISEKIPTLPISAEDFKNKLITALENFHDEIDQTKQRRVFSHGDMWSKNIAFKVVDDYPVDCKLLNLQFIRYAPPAYDVTEWICSAPDDIAKKNFHDFLNHYYTTLKIQLKSHDINIDKILSQDEFIISCKNATTFAKIMKAFYFSATGINDDYFLEICKKPDEFNKFFYEDRSAYLKNVYGVDMQFTSKLKSLIISLADDLKNDTLKTEDLHAIIKQDLGKYEYTLVDSMLQPFGCYQDNLKLEVVVKIEERKRLLNYFVKKMPDISSVKEKSLYQNSFLKEHAMFTKILPHFKTYSIDLETDVSKCYFSRLHDVIVFEDLSSQGYEALFHRCSLSYDNVLLAIKKMAAFHAKTMALEYKEKSEQGNDLCLHTIFKEYFVESIYYLPDTACNTFLNAAKLGIMSLIDYFHDAQSKLSKEILKEQVMKIYDTMAEYLKPSTKHINTLCHGDLSLHNLMFKFQSNIAVECAFVDYQSYRYAPPAHDLMSFIFLSTDRSFRKVYLEKIIELYFDELLENLKYYGSDVAQLMPSYSKFLESCNYYKLFAIAQSAIHFHYSMLTEEQLKALYAVPGANDKMFFEDRSEFVQNMCNTDPVYREKLRETINDLQDICGASKSLKKSGDRKVSASKLSFAPNVPFMAGRRYSRDAL